MLKNKIKLSLIDDYIKIVLIKNFYNNSFDCFNTNQQASKLILETRQLNQNLESIYDDLIARLKLNNISFDVLKENLESNNLLFDKSLKLGEKFLFSTIVKTNIDLNNIFYNLKEKLTKLKINMVI